MMPARPSRNARDRAQFGYSLPELLVVLVLMGLVIGAGTAAWQNYLRATSAMTSAQTVKMWIHQARLLAIYRGVNHFVVIDPVNRMVSVFEDNGLPAGSFDAFDTLVSRNQWESGVAMELPQAPSPLPRPLGAGNIANSWDLPTPDSGAAWGSTLKGLMATPEGKFMSAEATPVLIGTGTVVLTDPVGEERTVGIAVEGLSGTVRNYRVSGTSWEDL